MGKVIIYDPISKAGLDVLKNAGHQVLMRSDLKDADYKDVEGLIIRTSPLTADYLDKLPNLKVIARHGIGVNNIDIEYATQKGIIVANTPTANVVSVAEHVFGMMLYLARKFSFADKLVRTGRFKERDQYLLAELAGKTLAVIGYGKIGARVARIARKGFDMQVVAYDPFVKEIEEGISKVEALEELLPMADYVTLHTPLTKDTYNLIGEKQFDIMKKGSALINASRGEVVNMDALHNALTSGRLAAAALDVFPEEFPDLRHPIYKLDNVLFTPHNAALTEESMIRMATGAADAVVAVLGGQPPKAIVNIEVLKQ